MNGFEVEGGERM